MVFNWRKTGLKRRCLQCLADEPVHMGEMKSVEGWFVVGSHIRHGDVHDAFIV